MVSWLHWFAASLRPVELLAPRYGSDQEFPQPTGTFTPELLASRSPFSSSGITTVATRALPPMDFHPLVNNGKPAIEEPLFRQSWLNEGRRWRKYAKHSKSRLISCSMTARVTYS